LPLYHKKQQTNWKRKHLPYYIKLAKSNGIFDEQCVVFCCLQDWRATWETKQS